MVPIGTSYTATMKGSVLKLVACEECDAEYVYTLRRRAKGHGFSPLFFNQAGAQAQALQGAQTALQERLEHEVDEVPCPKCGHIQKHMFPMARKRYRRWMLVLGVWLAGVSAAIILLFGLINYMFAPFGPPVPSPLFTLVGIPGLLGLTLITAKVILASQYNPNLEDEEDRIRRGRKRASLRAEEERTKGRGRGR
jgi:Zn ribbon nucleic-acid-binding protein